ncbi:MAG TPA: SRPBCC domain-containing protein, partial [Longimicrobium sp.]
MTNVSTESTADRVIEQSRVFAAPRELVFTAFTDPDHIPHWWGPNGFTNTIHAMDVRPGGSFRFTMHGPDGTDWPNLIVYSEVVRPERLAYSHGSGKEIDSQLFQVTVTFE